MIRGRQIQKKTEIQTQRQIQRQTHTHRYGEIPNTQSQKDPNAKSQMFQLCPPTFGGESARRKKFISRLPEVRFKLLKKQKSLEFNSRDDGTIIWKV